MSFFEDHVVAIITAFVMILIGAYGWLLWTSWAGENTAETVILSNGSQSYACTVSQVDSKPHNCKPIQTQ